MIKEKERSKETADKIERMEVSLGTELVPVAADLYIRKHGATDHIVLQSTLPGGEGVLVASAESLPALNAILTSLVSARAKDVPEK